MGTETVCVRCRNHSKTSIVERVESKLSFLVEFVETTNCVTHVPQLEQRRKKNIELQKKIEKKIEKNREHFFDAKITQKYHTYHIPPSSINLLF